MTSGQNGTAVNTLERVRNYFDHRRNRTIAFSDLRTDLSLSYDQAEDVTKALKQDGFLTSPSFSNWRYDPPRVERPIDPEWVEDTPTPFVIAKSVVVEPTPPTIKEPYSREIVFKALQDLAPEGVTITQLIDLLDRPEDTNKIQSAVWGAASAGHLRSELDDSRKNGSTRYFWVDRQSAARTAPSAPAATASAAVTTPAVHKTEQPPTHTPAPAQPLAALLRKREAELVDLLQGTAVLQQELNRIRDLLTCYTK